MKLAFSNKDGMCYCCLCDWTRKSISLKDSEKKIRDHLNIWHNRILVSFDERGGGINYNERDFDGNFKKDLPTRIYRGSSDKIKWDKSRRLF